MKKISYHILPVLAALTVFSCQDELEPSLEGGVIAFNPSVAGTENIEETRASALVREDGCEEIPLWLEVTDGISVRSDGNPASSPLTRGTLVNGGSSSADLSGFATQVDSVFYLTAWMGSPPSRFIPSSGTYDTVKYSNSSWKSTSTYEWDGSDSRTFYAYANLPASGATVTNTAATAQTLTYTAVPDSASAQKDIILGYYSGTGTKNAGARTCSAGITFYHPLTSVRFKVGDISGTGIKFKGIYIKDVYKSGTATMSPTTMENSDSGDKFTWSSLSTTMKEVSYEYKTATAVSKGNIIGDNFILIPQDLSAKPVTVTIVMEISGTTHAFVTTLNTGAWKAGKTYTYTLKKEASYTFSFKNMSGETLAGILFDNGVESGINGIQLVESSKDGSTPLGFSAYYSTDNGSTWIPYDGATTGVVGLSAADNEGLASGYSPRLIELTAQPKVKPLDMYYWKDRNGEPDMKGSATAPIDLSKLPIGGEGSEGSEQHTANCYIVKHAGYYKFPCVYGNGRYTTEGQASGEHVLSTFVNAKGNAITSKYVLSDVTATAPKAALLWADQPALASDVKLNGSGSSAYISFKTPTRDNLTEGNAVIVLYDDTDSDGSYDEGEALWSWHIWVSNSNLGVDNVGMTTNRYGTFNFMSCNLGWCGKIGAQSTLVAPYKSFDIKLVQDESGKSVEFFVEQLDAEFYGVVGNSPIYQYGRKDPFAAQIQAGNVETATVASTKPIYLEDGSKVSSRTRSALASKAVSAADGKNNIAAMISNPGTANSYLYSDCWFYNLWSLSNVNHSQLAIDAPRVKTIYDPCPYGYMMPNPCAFISFTDAEVYKGGDKGEINGSWSSSTSPIQGAIINNDSKLFFPASGYYNPSDDTKRGFREYFYSWTMSPGDTQNEVVNIRNYETSINTFGMAMISWGLNTSSDAYVYPIGCYSRADMLPVRPVRDVAGDDDLPVAGTLLYGETFHTMGNDQIQISSYNTNPKAVYTFRYYLIPHYAVVTSPDYGQETSQLKARVNISKDTQSNVDGAYLMFWAGSSSDVYTVTISDIKTWGATKVNLKFSSFGSASKTCTVNGQTKTFTSSASNSFDFNLTGNETSISIVFKYSGSTSKSGIDNLELRFLE